MLNVLEKKILLLYALFIHELHTVYGTSDIAVRLVLSIYVNRHLNNNRFRNKAMLLHKPIDVRK